MTTAKIPFISRPNTRRWPRPSRTSSRVAQTAQAQAGHLVLTVRDMPEYQALVQRLFTAANNVRRVSDIVEDSFVGITCG